MPGRRVRPVTALLLSAILCAGLAACAPPPPAPPTPTVSVAAAITREITDWDEFTGRFAAVERVDLKPRVSGYVQRIAFTEGGMVAKGDLLFVIDPRPFAAEVRRNEAELARSRAALALAQDQLRRARTLRTAAAISQDEMDRFAEAALQAAAAVGASAAALDGARLNLGFTEVRAPIAGRIGRAEVTVGNLVQSGQSATLLATLVSVDPIYVDFDGDESVYLRHAALSRRGASADAAATGSPDAAGGPASAPAVFVGLANEAGFPHPGSIAFVDNQLDPATGTIHVRARIPNPDGLFTPGLFARLKLVGSGARQVVLVDDKAVGTDQDQRFVLVLGNDDTLAWRKVTPGRQVDGLRVIEQGLAAGETIVVNGLQRVRPGMKVIAQRVQMGAAQQPDAGAAAAVVPHTDRARHG